MQPIGPCAHKPGTIGDPGFQCAALPCPFSALRPRTLSIKGTVLWSSDDLNGLGMGISVDGASGDVYVAGFASFDEGVDTVVVHKVRATTILNQRRLDVDLSLARLLTHGLARDSRGCQYMSTRY